MRRAKDKDPKKRYTSRKGATEPHPPYVIRAARRAKASWSYSLHLEVEGRAYWLFFYEATRRSWTKDKNITGAVKANPVLNKMLGSKVTFLEKRILDAAAINIIARKFVPEKVTKPAKASQQTKQRAKKSSKIKGFGDVILFAEDLEY